MATAALLATGCSSPASTSAPTSSVQPLVLATVNPAAVTIGPPSTSTTPAPPSSTAVAIAPARFQTLPVGAALPSDAECAARVRPTPVEIRPENETYNRTRGHLTGPDADPGHPRFARVTGDFVGTTDEIIQWSACKWGIDEDVVRGQAAKETYWFQKNVGDFTTSESQCVPGHPLGVDGKPGQCPESIGILQIRYPFFKTTIADAITSTAYNLDLAYAVWRTCYEGEETWLNDVDRGKDYTAGDVWGCVGRWFAGRWYTDPANQYIAAVQDYVKHRIWARSDFMRYRE